MKIKYHRFDIPRYAMYFLKSLSDNYLSSGSMNESGTMCIKSRYFSVFSWLPVICDTYAG